MAKSSVQSSVLEIALRVLNAYSSYTPPAANDEAFLRKLASDMTTPSDDLACQIVQAELRKVRSQNKVSVAAAETNSNKHQGHTA